MPQLKSRWQFAISSGASLIAMFFVAMTPSYAQWVARATGPDVFGNEKVIALVPDRSGNTLVVQCNQKNSLYVAIISRGTQNELNDLSESSGLPAKLLVRVDQGKVEKFNAKLKQWNTKYLGIVAANRDQNLVELLRSIGSARSQISVGTDVMGSQDTASFGVLGSRNAMEAVIKHCKLSGVAAPPAP